MEDMIRTERGCKELEGPARIWKKLEEVGRDWKEMEERDEV